MEIKKQYGEIHTGRVPYPLRVILTLATALALVSCTFGATPTPPKELVQKVCSYGDGDTGFAVFGPDGQIIEVKAGFQIEVSLNDFHPVFPQQGTMQTLTRLPRGGVFMDGVRLTSSGMVYIPIPSSADIAADPGLIPEAAKRTLYNLNSAVVDATSVLPVTRKAEQNGPCVDIVEIN
jgi:hypothetical protein